MYDKFIARALDDEVLFVEPIACQNANLLYSLTGTTAMLLLDLVIY